MRKFTFLLVTVLIAALSFNLTAQKQNLESAKVPVRLIESSPDKSYWEGHQNLSTVYFVDPGTEFAIRLTGLDVGDEITQVRFFSNHEQWANPPFEATNQDFEIRIYKGGTFTPGEQGEMVYEMTGATEVYSESYFATEIGQQTVSLANPYQVVDGDEIWVSIELSGSATGVMSVDMNEDSNTYEGLYLYTFVQGENKFWLNNEFCLEWNADQTECVGGFGFRPMYLAVYIDDGGVYEEQSDMYAMFMENADPPYTEIFEIEISETEDLVLFPAIGNNGPDDTDDMANLLIEVDGTEIMNNDIDLSGEMALTSGYFAFLSETGDFVIEASNLDLLELSGVFDVCLTVTYAGNDPNSNNNQACLTVTRGTVSSELEVLENISVFPNPATDVITITNAENANVAVLSMLGEVVYTVENASANQNIDVSNLAAGTYFVRVDSEVFKINVVK